MNFNEIFCMTSLCRRATRESSGCTEVSYGQLYRLWWTSVSYKFWNKTIGGMVITRYSPLWL